MGVSLWQSLVDGTHQMVDQAFSDIESAADWERERPARHREFLRALGVDPLPERCDPQVTDYGTFSGEGYQARKLGFQILADCWGSATIYYPDPLPDKPAPAVLYVCGHAKIGTYNYQYHPIMWARRGYVCLIVNTIQQSDNPGSHYGALKGKLDEWLSLGYSSAGGEMYNAIRALDVLAADPKVDADRLAVTGVSGGGACSFYVACIDERIKAVSTLCGLCPPVDAVDNRHLVGHCDCMFPHNVYRRDLCEYAALIAPRAALFCFAEHDTLYHPEESKALVERTSQIYELLGIEDICRLVMCPGGHGDHLAFDKATAEWFDTHVAGEAHPKVKRGERELPEELLCIYNGQPPQPNRLEVLPQLVSPRGTLPLPDNPDDWPAIRDEAIAALREDIFARALKDDPDAAFTLDGDWRWGNSVTDTANELYRTQIAGMDCRLRVVLPPEHKPYVVMGIAGPHELDMMAMGWGRAGAPDDIAAVGLEPRLANGNFPPREHFTSPPGCHYRGFRTLAMRAMALLGTTPVMMTVHDILVALNTVCEHEALQDHEVYLLGDGENAVAALYAALLDDRVSGVIAQHLPASHADWAPILGILRHFDIPQAVGLLAPRKIVVTDAGTHDWTWPRRVFDRTGYTDHYIQAADLRDGLTRLMK